MIPQQGVQISLLLRTCRPILSFCELGNSGRTPRRFRHKEKWARQRKTTSTELALQAFDSMYGEGPFQSTWNSIRLALLSTPKYMAVVNNLSGKADQIHNSLTECGAFPLSNFLKNIPENSSVSSSASSQIETGTRLEEDRDPFADRESPENPEFIPASRVLMDKEFESQKVKVPTKRNTSNRLPILTDGFTPVIPRYLKIYLFPRGDLTRFPSPKVDSAGFHDYYLMDAASLLPVLAMDLKFGDDVLDICAAPGGKSLTMLQTMLPGSLTCNDVSSSRLSRIDKVLNSFLPMDSHEFSDKVTLTCIDARNLEMNSQFHRVLVDVPCTTDRLSCTENENNLFTSRRTGERNSLPETQMNILISACRTVKPGGTVVYSTCTLSPIQNDGVVHMALQRLKEDYNIDMTVMNSTSIREMFSEVFHFHRGSVDSYGITVLPHIANNFGPSYFCRLRRLERNKQDTGTIT